MKNFSSKITLLVSYSVHDNIWELWLFIREFGVAAMLNPSLKPFCEKVYLAGLLELKFWPLENEKRSKNKKKLKHMFLYE